MSTGGRLLRSINALAARYSLGSGDPVMRPQGWKRLAEGQC
jgi:hypothetical protein